MNVLKIKHDDSVLISKLLQKYNFLLTAQKQIIGNLFIAGYKDKRFFT